MDPVLNQMNLEHTVSFILVIFFHLWLGLKQVLPFRFVT